MRWINPSSIVTGFGMVVLALVALAALGESTFAAYNPTIIVAPSLMGPTPAHWLGTDQIGRDTLARIIVGARTAVVVALAAPILAFLVGVPLGLLGGYFRGTRDTVIMRFMDGIYALPGIIVALMLIAAVGPSLQSVVVAVALAHVPVFARIARGQTLSLRTREFVTAATVIGAGHPRIMARHVLPNALPPLVVEFFLAGSHAVTAEASLSFLGLGVPPPAPTWGSMLRDGMPFIQYAPWLALASSAAVFVTVLSINLAGDYVRKRV